MLQLQFDAEYQSSTVNQSPKAKPVTIVYSDDDEDYGLECPDEQRDYIRSVERAITVGGRGYATVNGQMITKHDPELCGHKNTQKITVSRFKCYQRLKSQNAVKILNMITHKDKQLPVPFSR